MRVNLTGKAMEMDVPYAIKISGVKKKYRLGQIGGGSLVAEVQSRWARLRGREDPNQRVGAKNLTRGDVMALDGIDLEIGQGETIGIIGANGAGKSTLLKIISRVTSPTEGEVDIYGKVASMLEVGTGFHGELTGRENVYLNGAILGMDRAEVTSKMNDIIDFSEIGEYIDTPVKRYSSGMYVKLAFSVAAHLDAQIMIMDEVLAVGDAAFRRKCIDKMRALEQQEGRTILCVSHNMETIRRLCDRCVVLSHGRLVFDGDTSDAIAEYMGISGVFSRHCEYPEEMHRPQPNRRLLIESADFGEGFAGQCEEGGTIDFSVTMRGYEHNPGDYDVRLRADMVNSFGNVAGMMFSDVVYTLRPGETVTLDVGMDCEHLTPGVYQVSLYAYTLSDTGDMTMLDMIDNAFVIEIISGGFPERWYKNWDGRLRLHKLSVKAVQHPVKGTI